MRASGPRHPGFIASNGRVAGQRTEQSSHFQDQPFLQGHFFSLELLPPKKEFMMLSMLTHDNALHSGIDFYMYCCWLGKPLLKCVVSKWALPVRGGESFFSMFARLTEGGRGSKAIWSMPILANCPAVFLSYFHCGFVMKYS